jgi:hypothetical protein
MFKCLHLCLLSFEESSMYQKQQPRIPCALDDCSGDAFATSTVQSQRKRTKLHLGSRIVKPGPEGGWQYGKFFGLDCAFNHSSLWTRASVVLIPLLEDMASNATTPAVK